MFKLFKLFQKAGATGHVFLLGGGRTKDKGLAYSGLIWPITTVAVVPTTSQIVQFSIDALTKDKQKVVVRGSLTATFIPATAVSKFDFTVDPQSGSYTGTWEKVLKERVIEHALRAVLNEVKDLNVEEAIRSQRQVEEAVTVALGSTTFQNDGITIGSCSIPKIEPADEEVRGAIGAGERQVMLTSADKALHDRRMKAVENDRHIKEYQARTDLTLEEERGRLIDEQGKNKLKEAEADANATTLRLAPLQNVEPGTLLGAALIEGLKADRIGTIVIGPELLGALQRK